MECFSSPGTLAMPPIYVLSQIPKLVECLIRHRPLPLKSTSIKPVKLPESFNLNSSLSETCLEYIKDAEVMVCDPVLLQKVYMKMPNLKWAHCTWAGVENLLATMTEKPSFVITRHAGEAFSSVMAEYVVCHILNWERQTKLCWKNQESKTWIEVNQFATFRTLDELNITVLGTGNMGSGIAKFLKQRGAEVVGFRRTSPPSKMSQACPKENIFSKISSNLDAVVEDCDYLINTLPSTPLTSGLLNNSVLSKCLKKPVFINVGRGNIIAEKDLLQALRNQWLSGAVLDVFETEPLPESSVLWSMPQVTITPHVSAISKPEHIASGFYSKLTNYAESSTMPDIVDFSAGY